MAVHKLAFDDFDEINYQLVAIHTSLEDYRLAYFINQKLPIKLSSTNNDVQIDLKLGAAKFTRFYYHDIEKEISWNLIQNKNEVIQNKKGNNQDLFTNVKMEVSTKVFLLPEFKKVDYFLKIDNTEEVMDSAAIQLQLNTIKHISTAYSVDILKIKSKNNLIF